MKSTKMMVFIILHYMSLEVTNRCILSILNNIEYSNYKIVIVDNGSPNRSGKELKKIYERNDTIDIICLNSNKGFASGNNIGYKYAKEKYNPDFIIMINNDTQIEQCDFLSQIEREFERNEYYVLGPDIINFAGYHLNPQRDHIITKKEATRWLFKKRVMHILIKVMYHLRLRKICLLLLRLYDKHKENTCRKNEWLKRKADVELQGSCLIFSPLFISKSQYAIPEYTFMYLEEAFLSVICYMNKWKVVYSPNLRIKHEEGCAMRSMYPDRIERFLLQSDMDMEGIIKLKQLLDLKNPSMTAKEGSVASFVYNK